MKNQIRAVCCFILTGVVLSLSIVTQAYAYDRLDIAVECYHYDLNENGGVDYTDREGLLRCIAGDPAYRRHQYDINYDHRCDANDLALLDGVIGYYAGINTPAQPSCPIYQAQYTKCSCDFNYDGVCNEADTQLVSDCVDRFYRDFIFIDGLSARFCLDRMDSNQDGLFEFQEAFDWINYIESQPICPLKIKRTTSLY